MRIGIVLVSVVCLGLFVSPAAAETLVWEKFTTGIPGTWEVTVNNGFVTSHWYDGTGGFKSTYGPQWTNNFSGRFAYADNYYDGPFTYHDTDLISDLIDLTPASNTSLTFSHSFLTENSSVTKALVYVRDKDDVAWILKGTYTADQFDTTKTINVSSALDGKDKAQIRF
ncbi:MAG: hypothetical protein H6683_09400, partial [Deltaproteobacteria bacterium]|nr:hypothetical protein [Deltaproteobacteria bacterium]